jgi:hypothetical protein
VEGWVVLCVRGSDDLVAVVVFVFGGYIPGVRCMRMCGRWARPEVRTDKAFRSLPPLPSSHQPYLQQPDAVRRKDAGGEAVEEAVEDQGQDETHEPLLGLGVVVKTGLFRSIVEMRCNHFVFGWDESVDVRQPFTSQSEHRPSSNLPICLLLKITAKSSVTHT